jgi:hypothetical protein
MSTPRGQRWMTAALLAAALLPFARTLLFGYILDDTTAIRGNPDIAGWSSLLTLWTKPYLPPASGLYRPLTMTVLAVLWNAGGHFPIWFHAVVIAAHAAACVLVWRLLRCGVSPWPAFLAALWFAVHPIHVEAVANIANSSEVFVAIWTCALALLLARDDATSWKTALIAGVLYLAALLTKESGVVAPILAMVWAWGWPLSPARRSPLTARLLAAWLAAILIVVTLRMVVLGGAVTGGPIAGPGLDVLTTAQRVWAMLALGPTIGALLVWPVVLNPHYGPTALAHLGPSVPAVLTIVLLAASVFSALHLGRRGDRRLAVALVWIVVSFLPASNLLTPTGQILAERTLYGASIGIAMLVALALDAARARLGSSASLARAGVAAVVVLIGTAAWRTANETKSWRSHTALFQQMIVADPAGYRGYWLSGMLERDAGRTAAALAWLDHAYGLYPRDRQLLIDYAETLLMHHEPARAATIATHLMDWPELRRRPEAVSLYLSALEQAYGPDSVSSARARLRQLEGRE